MLAFVISSELPTSAYLIHSNQCCAKENASDSSNEFSKEKEGTSEASTILEEVVPGGCNPSSASSQSILCKRSKENSSDSERNKDEESERDSGERDSHVDEKGNPIY